jgi:hypothetical protein
MRRPIGWVLAVALLMAGGAATGQQINDRKGADPGAKAKIGRAMPQSRVQQGDTVQSYGGQSSRSCNVNVGNVKTEKGEKAPREVITVIRGDVVNTCR